jgi:hypothetical protein
MIVPRITICPFQREVQGLEFLYLSFLQLQREKAMEQTTGFYAKILKPEFLIDK